MCAKIEQVFERLTGVERADAISIQIPIEVAGKRAEATG
jgi:hypothetical protein